MGTLGRGDLEDKTSDRPEPGAGPGVDLLGLRATLLYFRVPLLIAAIALLAFHAPGEAAWSTDSTVNSPICRESNDQVKPVSCADGVGGVILAWSDSRSGVHTIRAERLRPDGAPLWSACGVAAGQPGGYQFFPSICPDGQGGAFVFWQQWNTELRGQHFSASGTPLWGDGGVAFTAGPVERPATCEDGQGGAFVVWSERAGAAGTPQVRIQRVHATGATAWTPGGVQLDPAAAGQYRPTITPDGTGGAIVAWIQGVGTPTRQLVAQRISAAGTPQWTPRLIVGSARGLDAVPSITGSGLGTSIVAWSDSGASGDYDIFAHGIAGDGQIRWGSVLAIGQRPSNQLEPAICADGARGAFIAWEDHGDPSFDIRMVRLGFNATLGAGSWSLAGRRACAAPGAQRGPSVAFDDAGGVVVSWVDYRDDVGGDLYAQRVRLDGSSGGPTITVSSITPGSGSPGGAVSVSGSGFPADARVLFDRALDPSATATSGTIAAEVPAGARSGPITVLAPRDGAALSDLDFGVLRTLPVAATAASSPRRPWFAAGTLPVVPTPDGGRTHRSVLGLGDPDPLRWRAFVWSAQRARYLELGVEADSIAFGQGFWVETAASATISPTGVETPWRDARVPLESTTADTGAWHLVGNPFPIPVRGWQLLLEHDGVASPLLVDSRGVADPMAWRWDRTAQAYAPVSPGDSIGPADAFWVRVRSGQGGPAARNVLIVAAPGARFDAPAPAVPTAEWEMSLSARQGERRSAPLRLGYRRAAEVARVEPPVGPPPAPYAEAIQLAVIDPATGRESVVAIGAGDRWNVRIDGLSLPGDVTLTTTATAGTAPPALEVTRASGEVLGVISPGGGLVFHVRAATEDLLLRVCEGCTPGPVSSHATARSYAYPNPGTRAIGFVVPAHRPSELRAVLMDAGGRVVRRFARAVDAPGSVTFLWDGRDARGGGAPAGVYFLSWWDPTGGRSGIIRAVLLQDASGGR